MRAESSRCAVIWIARVEREAKVTLNDAQIEQWVTLADLLDAVSDAASNH